MAEVPNQILVWRCWSPGCGYFTPYGYGCVCPAHGTPLSALWYQPVPPPPPPRDPGKTGI